jgi:hypothetical protein
MHATRPDVMIQKFAGELLGQDISARCAGVPIACIVAFSGRLTSSETHLPSRSSDAYMERTLRGLKMGMGFARHQLVGRINDAFHPDNIADSADKVAHLGQDADAFDIVHELGLFQFPPGMDLNAYRASLPIPSLNNAIMAQAFQHAVTNKIPLSFAIASGHAEAIQVTTSDKLVSVVLTRVD